MHKTIDFIGPSEIEWCFYRHTPPHNAGGCQNALIFNGFHMVSVVCRRLCLHFHANIAIGPTACGLAINS